MPPTSITVDRQLGKADSSTDITNSDVLLVEDWQDFINFSLSSNFSASLFFKSILRNVDLVFLLRLFPHKNEAVVLSYRFHVFEQYEIELNKIVHVMDPLCQPKLGGPIF